MIFRKARRMEAFRDSRAPGMTVGRTGVEKDSSSSQEKDKLIGGILQKGDRKLEQENKGNKRYINTYVLELTYIII